MSCEDIDEFPFGSTATLAFTFTNLADDELFDPERVLLVVQRPSEEEDVVDDDIVRDSLGTYHYNLGPLDESGTWTYAPIGLGGAIPAIRREYEFKVTGTRFNDPMGEDS